MPGIEPGAALNVALLLLFLYHHEGLASDTATYNEPRTRGMRALMVGEGSFMCGMCVVYLIEGSPENKGIFLVQTLGGVVFMFVIVKPIFISVHMWLIQRGYVDV